MLVLSIHAHDLCPNFKDPTSFFEAQSVFWRAGAVVLVFVLALASTWVPKMVTYLELVIVLLCCSLRPLWPSDASVGVIRNSPPPSGYTSFPHIEGAIGASGPSGR